MIADVPYLKLTVQRRPFSTDKVTEFPATFSVEEAPTGQRWLDLRFGTNPGGKGSIFHAAINPQDFAIVAQLMMEAHPECAIRAFGKALEGVKIQRQSDQSSSEEAA